MHIKVLFENSKQDARFKSGHGLSLLINYSGKKYLFDTGANRKLIHNASEMQETLMDLDGVIISHGHSDHTGGLQHLSLKKVPVYALKGANAPHYLKLLSRFLYVGMSTTSKSKLNDNLKLITSQMEIIPNFHLIPLGKSTTLTKNLYKQQNSQYMLDDFSDELMVVIEQNDGLVVFTGCSHHGIVNMTNEALRLFPNKPIKYLVGGFHMIGVPYINNLGMSRQEIAKIGDELNHAQIENILTCHCTGQKAFSLLKKRLGTKLQQIKTGQTIELI